MKNQLVVSATGKATDYSAVQTEWELQDGFFVAGIDIPAGVFDVVAIQGIGYISSYDDSANHRGPGYDSYDEYSPDYFKYRV